jgi:outer membrane protein assembly factor BamD (BamD/ComL family)
MKYLYLLALPLALLFSCKSKSRNDHDALREQLKNLLKGHRDNVDSAKKADVLLKEFLRTHAEDSVAPKALYLDAQINMAPLQNYDQAVQQLERLSEKYPKSPYADTALFVAGNIYENNFRNLTLARKKYEAVIQRMPGSKFADAAKLSLNTLGKDQNAVLDSLIKKNTDSMKNPENSDIHPPQK